MNTVDSFAFLDSCADLLDRATSAFTRLIDNPKLTVEAGPVFRFEKPDVREYAILQCIRIVSGLRATLHLLAKGYFQEAGVIARTLLEFSHNLNFIHEGFVNKERVPRINKRIQQYFSEHTRTAEERMAKSKKGATFIRKKVYAAIGRMLGKDNPYRFQQIAKVLEDAYSGYVHGNYINIMEMYNGGKQRFETSGVLPRTTEWLHYIALIVHPILNQFSTIAIAFNLKELESILIKKRKDLETSPLYKKQKR